ncbi:MAG: ABC transporter permease subunit [Bdellovibrionaceae bacterium]|nr:ABC transporter permease subunit [Pseudobdellovibrionaceae bacterium]
MWIYFVKRFAMILPTLFGITLLSFTIINLAPGSPLEQQIQKMKFASGATGASGGGLTTYGVSEEVLEALKVQYGFDKPLLVRYWIWLKNVFTLDFGDSFSTYDPVIDMIIERFPVSMQFGLVSLFLMYLICIPLGVLKAVKDGTHFDAFSSFILFVMYSVPSLMLGILLIVFFAGGSFFDWFPLGGLYSENYEMLTWSQKIIDRVHHFILPMACYMIGSFTVLTFLMKNSLLDVIKMDYIRTARAKGLDERKVIYKHALRNALIPLATGLSSILGIFLAGSIIIEQIFGLEGIGLLSYKAALDRDYNVLMGLIFIQSILMLVGRIISDFLYIIIDPRIDFK